MNRTHQQNAPSLTPELWAKVFAHLEQRPDFIHFCIPAHEKRNQAKVHQLKLVCKQFRSIFESHTELVQRLYVDADFSFPLVPSLLAWLQQHKSSIRMLQSKCASPLLDIVMGGLLSAPNIKLVDMSDVSACTTLLAGTFQKLEKCTLAHRQVDHLDLAPLGGLLRLNHLGLHGRFKELHHLKGLTHLECNTSRVLDVHVFAPALQYLAIEESDLEGIHAQGLQACTALTHLLLENACLKGNNAEVYLDGNLSVVSTIIGQLTRLHTLSISTNITAHVLVQLNWVSELTSLQDLSMGFDQNHGSVFHHLSTLTKLTHWDIYGYDDLDEAPVFHVDFEWHKLQALQYLSLESKKLSFGRNICGLLRLPQLQQCSFAGSATCGSYDANCLAALVYSFARLRPQVKLVFECGDLLNFPA